MAISVEQISERLNEKLVGITKLEIIDLTGTQDHYEARIVATAFKGKTLIEQHQMVYSALGEWMHGPIHALALKTSAE